jgi:hypothetical protein
MRTAPGPKPTHCPSHCGTRPVCRQVPNPETTGTAGILVGLAWGVRNGILDASAYTPVISAAWAGPPARERICASTSTPVLRRCGPVPVPTRTIGVVCFCEALCAPHRADSRAARRLGAAAHGCSSGLRVGPLDGYVRYPMVRRWAYPGGCEPTRLCGRTSSRRSSFASAPSGRQARVC